jgi:hypothetical protein
MNNGDWVDEGGECCPVHGNRMRKRYGFGFYAKAPVPTAWVTTYKGCNCATQTNGGSLRTLYFDNYQSAAGEARYTCNRLEY